MFTVWVSAPAQALGPVKNETAVALAEVFMLELIGLGGRTMDVHCMIQMQVLAPSPAKLTVTGPAGLTVR